MVASLTQLTTQQGPSASISSNKQTNKQLNLFLLVWKTVQNSHLIPSSVGMPLCTHTDRHTHRAAAGWHSYFYFNFTKKTKSIKEAAVWVWCCITAFILFLNIYSENQEVTAQNSFNKQKDKNANKGNPEFFGPPAAWTAEQTEFVWKRRFPISLRRWIFFNHRGADMAVCLCSVNMDGSSCESCTAAFPHSTPEPVLVILSFTRMKRRLISVWINPVYSVK